MQNFSPKQRFTFILFSLVFSVYSFSQCGIGTTITTFPYTESFESSSPGTWYQATDDTGSWSYDTGTTPSSNTGPNGASDGNVFLFTEASTGATNGNIVGANGTAFLDSPCLDLTGFSTPIFTFDYHMAGASMGNLKVQISTDNGTNWTDTGWFRNGAQQAYGTPWLNGSINFTPYVGQTIRLRFHATTGNGWSSDIAIDNISFINDIPQPEIDVIGLGNSITDGDTTPNTLDNTDFGNYNIPSVPVSHTFVIENTGLLPLSLTGGPLVSITGPNAADFTVTANPTTPVASGGSTSFTIAFSSAAAGTKNATVTIANNDLNESTYNFSITGNALVPPPCTTINTYPYSESFESGLGAWTQGTGDNGDWSQEGAGIGAPGTGTPSNNTGPNGAFSGNRYIFTEASTSGLGSNAEAFLDSPCFDLTGLNNPEFSFSYHMYGLDSGTLKIQISTDNGTSFVDQGWFQSREVQTSGAGAWLSISVDLSEYIDQTIKLRIYGRTGNGYRSDMAMDALSLTDPTLTIGPGGVTTSLRTWLKATDGLSYSNGQDVSLWQDQGNGADAVVHTAGQEPTYYDDPAHNINFNPVINFDNDNTASVLSADPTLLPQKYLVGESGFYTQDIFIVTFPNETITSSLGYMDLFAGDSNRANSFPASIYGADYNDFTGVGWGDFNLEIDDEVIACSILNDNTGGYYDIAQTGTSLSYDNGGIINAFNNPSNSGKRLNFNGANIANTELGTSNFIDIYDSKFWLGRSKFYSGSYNGKVAEVITYAHRKDDLDPTQERNRIQSYLAIKYGITLGTNGTSQDYVNSDGTVIWDQSANAGYNYNITGIGRDDASELNQKQSLSTNNGADATGPTEAILTMGHLDIHDTNNLNPNSLADKQFLVWGDNNGDLNLSNTFNYDLSAGIGGLSTPVVYESTQRVWKVVESGGDVGEMKLSIPISAVRSITPPGDYYMFISETGVFTATDEYRLMTQVGTGATATLETTYDFDNTKYITFGYAEEVTAVRSVYFDGTNDYVDAGDNLNLNSEFTVSAWIKRDAGTTNASIFSKMNDAYTEGYDFRINNSGYVRLVWRDSGSWLVIQSNVVIPENEWHHVAVTYKSSETKLYIDGVLDEDTLLPAPPANNESFFIGANGTTNPDDFFGGNIDEIRIWDTELDVNQIRYIMNQEIQDNAGMADGTILPTTITKNDVDTIPWNELAAYFPMSRYTYTNVKDDSGNNNTGLMKNMNTVDFQTAPLPYESQANGVWNSGATWANNAVQPLPNSVAVADATQTIDWNIIRTNHDIRINTETVLGHRRSALALIIDSNTLSVNGATASGTGNALTVTHYLKIDGKLDLNGESQLIQTTGSDLDVTSSGSLERDQQGTQDLFTYNYWSSPVGITNNTSNNNSYTLPDVFFDGTSPAAPIGINYLTSSYNGSNGSPIGLADYWIWKFNNHSSGDYSEWQHVRSTGTLLAGEGFTLKGVDNTGGALSNEQNYVFDGKPNNGDISLTITAGNDYLVGNPYPSALDAIQFLTDNGPTIDQEAPATTGTLYFWEHWGGGSHNLADYQGGYATYNLSGAVGAASIGTNDPDVATGGTPTKIPGRYIPVAQGFFITGESTGSINFNNGQRYYEKEGANSIFLRSENGQQTKTSNRSEDDRMKIRLGFNSINTIHRQLLLTVDPKATEGIDWGYDGESNEDQMDDMYWMLDNQKFSIQGINAINASSIIPLGLHTKTDGINTITIDKLEHVPNTLIIYLHDKELEVYHDLQSEDYSIDLTTGEYLDRFELTFASKTIQNESTDIEIETDIEFYYSNTNKSIIINNPSLETLASVELFNIIGQSIIKFDDFKSLDYNEIKIKNISSGNYIIKLKTENDEISKKIIID